MPDQTPPIRWQPEQTPQAPPWPVPPLLVALGRGALGRCPACGQTRAFAGYLKVVPQCVACGAPLGSIRADDAPPYFTIFIVGHIIVGLLLWVEKTFKPELWVHAALWLPLTVALSFMLMQPVKGATLGLMLRLGLTKPSE